ncbi:type III polyketide synthase [Halomonas sp. TRM85114]|uniref:type III polyketide synthase n=1 Tax=Halomonas jincaotanensis TaxID=2810616 RepID=UPI001BD4AC15|nr:type III polyketide synthase [Halomonas jincaotanensis]MBS9404593.1 type III polyketide synthase [Halomonas jincaotanensis]
MTTLQASILGLGVASPPALTRQETAATLAQVRCGDTPRQQAWVRRLYRHSGIQRRGSVLVDAEQGTAGFEAFFPVPQTPDERGPTTASRLQRYEREAPPLAEAACRRALANATIDPGEITHLVCVSCTGMMAPGLDAHLVERLGLSVDIGRLHLGFMGCHGALNGLRTASALAQMGARPRVLVCCVELCSLHFQYGWDAQRIVANGLFADGAGAVVVGGASENAWRLVDTASRLTSGSADAMTWRIGDHGFEMTLSSAVPKLIRGTLAAWVEQWLAGHGMTLGDIRHWVIHPGGPEILRAATSALALPEQAAQLSAEVLAEHGNMSSPTVLFILERLRAQGATGPCVTMGFGPGLSLEAALILCE